MSLFSSSTTAYLDRTSVANDGPKFYLRTNKDAPQYRVVEFDLTNPAYTLRDVIPEDKGAHLEQAISFDNDKLVVVYKRNVCIFWFL